MKFKKKQYLLIVSLGFLIVVSIIPRIHANSDEYELKIDDNSIIVYEVIDADEEKIEDLLDIADLDDDDFDYEEDDKIKYDVSSISGGSDEDDYVIYYKRYVNGEDHGAGAENIAKDPKDLAEDLEDLELDDYSITFVLTDTEDYIDEVGDEVSDTYKPFISTSGSSIVLNASFGGFLYWLKMDYDKRGILEEMSLVYDGEEIFNMEQKNYAKSPQVSFFWILIFILIIISVVIIAIIALVVFLMKKSKKKEPAKGSSPYISPVDTKTEQLTKTQVVTGAGIEKEPQKVQYCPECGEKRESDADFCVYCGYKF